VGQAGATTSAQNLATHAPIPTAAAPTGCRR